MIRYLLTAVMTFLQVSVAAYATPTSRVPVVYPSLTGKSYAEARRVLIAHGNIPLDFREENQGCNYGGGICSYKELVSCFADVPYCEFSWKTPDGLFLHVQTHNPDYVKGAPIDVIWTTDKGP